MTHNKFKVNDWVIPTSYVDPEPQKITKIELGTAPDEEDFVFFREDWCVDMKYIEHWVPKELNFCWSDYYGLVQIVKSFNYKFEVKCFYVIKNLNDNPIVGLEELEPFIGELPTRVQKLRI